MPQPAGGKRSMRQNACPAAQQHTPSSSSPVSPGLFFIRTRLMATAIQHPCIGHSTFRAIVAHCVTLRHRRCGSRDMPAHTRLRRGQTQRKIARSCHRTHSPSSLVTLRPRKNIPFRQPSGHFPGAFQRKIPKLR